MPKSKERCEEIKEKTRADILRGSMLYFARNGFAGTKISELAKEIGVAPGTIYIYFDSKEDLFREIISIADFGGSLKELEILSRLPLSAKAKLHRLSVSVLKRLETEEDFAAKTALNTQFVLEKNDLCTGAVSNYNKLYSLTADMIAQGQKEGSAAGGSPMKLADYYWGVVYLYSLKKLFTSEYEMISVEDLERTVLI